MRQPKDEPRSARRANVRTGYTDDDHKFIETSFKAILNRAYPLPAEDEDDRFQALLDALSRVSDRDG